MKVAAVQMHPRFGNPKRNRGMIRRYCQKAASREIDLVVFPELCVSGYNFSSIAQVRSLSEVVPDGLTTQLLIEQAEQYSLTIVAGIAEQGLDNRFYNSAVIIDPNGFLGKYRKMHLFAREKEWFSPGDKPPRVFSTPRAIIGVLVCFDWAFPEASRILMLEGCEILCLPANLVLPYAQQAMITRSIENRIFTVVANRIGTERTLRFTGRSQITSPKGDILARGGTQRTGLFMAKVNPKQAKDKFLTKTNHVIEDRRIELYDRLLLR
jgi:predicted amidohydrolase